jgi:hypothetical protein
LIPGREKIFVFSIASSSGAHPGYEAEVKNGGAIPPLPLMFMA